jgi:hypothetical protein
MSKLAVVKAAGRRHDFSIGTACAAVADDRLSTP